MQIGSDIARMRDALIHMSHNELDGLIERARRELQHRGRPETERERLRREILARIAESGFSPEEIFAGTGRGSLTLLRELGDQIARGEHLAKP